jgi:hypothetical protein
VVGSNAPTRDKEPAVSHPKPLPEPLLRRAAACLRPPGATGAIVPLSDGTGWQDPASGRAFRVRDGKVLAMTIVYELHDVHRFERVQQFASYARLVKCAKESAGKRKGSSGAKMGNVHLKWAFSEAAVLFVRHSVEAKVLLARLTKRHGKGKALSILAHKTGRAAYYVLVREKPFDSAKFFAHAS